MIMLKLIRLFLVVLILLPISYAAYTGSSLNFISTGYFRENALLNNGNQSLDGNLTILGQLYVLGDSIFINQTTININSTGNINA